MSGSMSTASLTRPTLNEGKGGQSQVIWETRFKACLGINRLGEILQVNFDSTLPAAEGAVLDKTNAGKKEQIKARAKNCKCMAYLMVAMLSARLSSLIAREKKRDPN